MRRELSLLLVGGSALAIAATYVPAAGATCVPGRSPADFTIHLPVGWLDSTFETFYIILWSSNPGYIQTTDIWLYQESTARTGLQRHDYWRDDSCGDSGIADF